MHIPRPKGWRKGQTIFNFLEWCGHFAHLPLNQAGPRCGDPFYVSDERFDRLWAMYTADLGVQTEEG